MLVPLVLVRLMAEPIVAVVVWVIGGTQLILAALTVTLLAMQRTRRHTGVSSGRSPRREATSRLWWRRLDVARALTTLESPSNPSAFDAPRSDTTTLRALLRTLLGDPHPAVQCMATASLLRTTDESLVAQVLEGLAQRSPAVRSYQIGVLRHQHALVMPLLWSRLRADAPPAKLTTYIEVAAAIGSRECIDEVAALSIHPHAEVRIVVARALRRLADERTVIKLLAMLRDPDWRVRVQAARALGAIHDEQVIPALLRALTDPSWWVRFRAALALAEFGAEGRKALEDAEFLPDRYARDMAALVRGLSHESFSELVKE